jgi:hypothetical protein
MEDVENNNIIAEIAHKTKVILNTQIAHLKHTTILD